MLRPIDVMKIEIITDNFIIIDELAKHDTYVFDNDKLL